MKRRFERGFTLIELLIIIAILGILAAVIIPRVEGVIDEGNLARANTEAENVNLASVAYMAEEGYFPDNSTQLEPYLTGVVKGVYIFDDEGLITTAIGWNFYWDKGSQQWLKDAPEEE